MSNCTVTLEQMSHFTAPPIILRGKIIHEDDDTIVADVVEPHHGMKVRITLKSSL